MNKKEYLLSKIKQTIDLLNNYVNLYHFSMNQSQIVFDSSIILEKKRRYHLELVSSLKTLELYENNLNKLHLNPILLIEQLYVDFLKWIKRVERLCKKSMLKITFNKFENIYSENYATIYEDQSVKVENMDYSDLLLEDGIDDDW